MFKKLCIVMIFISMLPVVLAKPILYSKEGVRFRLVKENKSQAVNWVFVPGGPGLGSEYMEPFVRSLQLPGAVWLLDMPGDGSNRLNNKPVNYKDWPKDLGDAIKSMPNVILVAHSFGGMLTLSSPGLQGHLQGLVLIDTAPNNQWMASSGQFQSKAIIKAQKAYLADPNDKTLKSFTLATAPFFFLKKDQEKGKQLLENLPYNNQPMAWVMKDFDPSYDAKWVPQDIPVLIIMGQEDILTPPKLFKADKRFQRNNIKMVIIPNAAHFSWIGQEATINKLLLNYFKKLKSKTTSPNN